MCEEPKQLRASARPLCGAGVLGRFADGGLPPNGCGSEARFPKASEAHKSQASDLWFHSISGIAGPPQFRSPLGGGQTDGKGAEGGGVGDKSTSHVFRSVVACLNSSSSGPVTHSKEQTAILMASLCFELNFFCGLNQNESISTMLLPSSNHPVPHSDDEYRANRTISLFYLLSLSVAMGSDCTR